MFVEPCAHRRHGRVGEVAFQQLPHARHELQIARLAVALQQPREDADDARVALRADRGVGPVEGVAVELRERGDVALRASPRRGRAARRAARPPAARRGRRRPAPITASWKSSRPQAATPLRPATIIRLSTWKSNRAIVSGADHSAGHASSQAAAVGLAQRVAGRSAHHGGPIPVEQQVDLAQRARLVEARHVAGLGGVEAPVQVDQQVDRERVERRPRRRRRRACACRCRRRDPPAAGSPARHPRRRSSAR